MLCCVGMGLTMLANQPLGERAFKQDGVQSGTASVPASEAVGVSIQQFMRQHGVTPGDNPLAKKSPRRISIDDCTGERLAWMNVYEVNPDDGTVTSKNKTWTANLIAGDTTNQVMLEDFCEIDYNAAADSAGYDEDVYFMAGGIIPINLPIEFDWNTGAAMFRTDIPIFHDEEFQPDPGNDKFKNKKVVDVFIVPIDGLSPEDAIMGTLYEDGSIVIEDGFMLRTRLAYKTWKGASLIWEDTVYVDSPVYSEMYLLKPNGIHEYKKVSRVEPSGGSSGHITKMIDSHLIGDIYLPNGIGGKKPVKPGSGGIQPIGDFRPIGTANGSWFPSLDPVLSLNRNNNSGFDLGHFHFNRFIDGITISPYDPNGFGGKKPVKPGSGDGDLHFFEQPSGSGFNPLFSRNSDDTPGTFRAGNLDQEGDVAVSKPVFMYQMNDTVYIWNLYGKMMMDHYMIINSDGTMWFPKQEIGKFTRLDADGVVISSSPLYNHSAASTNFGWNSTTPGCTGTVTVDEISWGVTVPYTSNIQARFAINYCYTDNRLYFTDGQEFSLEEMLNITAVTRKINEAMEGKCSITDVTTLINRSLNQR